MPTPECEIEKLKVRFENFEQDFRDRCKREDEYMVEFKKNLHDVSENLQKVMDKQNSQVGFIAGVTSVVTLLIGFLAWFFSK